MNIRYEDATERSAWGIRSQLFGGASPHEASVWA